MRLAVPSLPIWDSYDHEWEEVEDMSDRAVECIKCGCPGELDRKTGEVDWPTT